jgi:quinol monooxygenase YgiN
MKQNDVQWIVEFTINKDKLDAFKQMVREITRIVKQNEFGCRSYQWYFNDDETKCVITEWYSDQEAALAHLNGEGATKLLPKLLEIAKITRLEIYGEPGEEVRSRLTKLGGKMFHFFTGFSR